MIADISHLQSRWSGDRGSASLSRPVYQTARHYILEYGDLNDKIDNQRTRKIKKKNKAWTSICPPLTLFRVQRCFYILRRPKDSRIGRTVVTKDNGSVGLFEKNGGCRTAILLRYFHGESASTISLPSFFFSLSLLLSSLFIPSTSISHTRQEIASY